MTPTDSLYVQSYNSQPEHPPAMTQTAQIPVIDVSGSQPEAEVAKALVDAAATYGFVYVKNEGKDISVAVIDRMFELVRVAP